MNYHPLLVHFPVALLTIYSLFELVRFKKVLELPYWFYVKAILLIVGVASTGPTILSGLIIKDIFAGAFDLVRLHYLFAYSTTTVYGLLAVIYILTWMKKKVPLYPQLLVWGSLLGLVLLTITGSLGGVIAFGQSLDPVTDFFYRLFFR